MARSDCFGNYIAKCLWKRQAIGTDKARRLVNDANDYANQAMENPKYPSSYFSKSSQ